MTFNIGEFKATLNRYGGVLRSNKFVVRMTPPPFIRDAGVSRDLEYFAEQATLPGVNLSSHDVRRYGYGPIEKRPIGHTFTDLSVTFIADGRGEMHRFFYNWLNFISPYNFDTSNSLYLMDYKIRYVTSLDIVTLNEAGVSSINSPGRVSDERGAFRSTAVTVREAFPISLSDVQLNWSEMNNHARFTVQFAYVDWSYTRPAT